MPLDNEGAVMGSFAVSVVLDMAVDLDTFAVLTVGQGAGSCVFIDEHKLHGLRQVGTHLVWSLSMYGPIVRVCDQRIRFRK
jgi:hypothetical protein